eukprot:s8513_g1.t1
MRRMKRLAHVQVAALLLQTLP